MINAIRAHLAEFGIVAPVGRNGVEELLNIVVNPNDKRVPEIARAVQWDFAHTFQSERHLDFNGVA